MKTIGFMGTGNMAGAIIKGISDFQMDTEILAVDHNSDKVTALQKYGVKVVSSSQCLAECSDVLFLAVKPQNFEEALAEIKGHLRLETVIVSIAAGITAEYICTELDYSAKIVLAMPNTPLMLGYGATALAKRENVSDCDFAFIRQIFDCAGMTVVIPENRMNEIIPINGSSPAFIYQYAKCFIDYGVSAGLDEELCLKLFAQTLIGSAKMMIESEHSIDDLIRMVSSKGGTTIAGLNALEKYHFSDAVKAACEQTVSRAYELSK